VQLHGGERVVLTAVGVKIVQVVTDDPDAACCQPGSGAYLSGEPVLVGEGGGSGAGGQVEFGEDVAEVAGHGLFADHQLGCDVPVGPAGGN
jgi:hypothetical protein